VDEVLSHLEAVVGEGKAERGLPSLPVGVDPTG
jgi:hypothetical protein